MSSRTIRTSHSGGFFGLLDVLSCDLWGISQALTIELVDILPQPPRRGEGGFARSRPRGSRLIGWERSGRPRSRTRRCFWSVSAGRVTNWS